MIKSGYTYRATWDGDPVIVYVVRRNGHVMEVEHLTGRLPGQGVTIQDRDRPEWTEVCKGRHSNPDALLTQTPGDDQLAVGTVRIGRTTKARYEVLAVHGVRVWTISPGDGTCDWSVDGFLRSTNPVPAFFEEGHDYERRGRLVTVRHVGKMSNGEPYAVAERRNGPLPYGPLLLERNSFPTYEDVTK